MMLNANASTSLQINLKPIAHDEDLAKKIMLKDRDGFRILYSKYWNPLLNYASNYLEDEMTCEEIVQGLFVHLYLNPGKTNINSSLSSYLFVAVRNKIYNYLRDQAVYRKHIEKAGYVRTKFNNVEQFVNVMELQREIHFSLRRMPERYKEVYLLWHDHQYTIRKISEILSRPVDTVEKQLRRARGLVRDHLRGHKMHI